jgi:hypothetical protein
MLRFKLGTVRLEFFGKLSLGLFVLRALHPSQNFTNLLYSFLCAVGLNGQQITARLVPVSRKLMRL